MPKQTLSEIYIVLIFVIAFNIIDKIIRHIVFYIHDKERKTNKTIYVPCRNALETFAFAGKIKALIGFGIAIAIIIAVRLINYVILHP